MSECERTIYTFYASVYPTTYALIQEILHLYMSTDFVYIALGYMDDTEVGDLFILLFIKETYMRRYLNIARRWH